MKIRIFGRLLVFGAGDREEIRKKRQRAMREMVRIVEASKAPSDSPIDLAAEFSETIAALQKPEGALTAGTGMSARERIIMVTALLDEMLRLIITLKMSASRGSYPSRNALKSIFSGTNVLASFGDRIAFCSAFGLLPNEVKGDLVIMKELRNEYAAHTFTMLSFDTPEIAVRCLNLQRKIGLEKGIFKNEYEQRFVDSAWMIVISLLFVAILLINEHKVQKEHIDAIIKDATVAWREIVKSVGWDDLRPEPASSP